MVLISRGPMMGPAIHVRSGGTSHGLKKPVESVRTLPACADCADQALARRKQLRMLQRRGCCGCCG